MKKNKKQEKSNNIIREGFLQSVFYETRDIVKNNIVYWFLPILLISLDALFLTPYGLTTYPNVLMEGNPLWYQFGLGNISGNQFFAFFTLIHIGVLCFFLFGLFIFMITAKAAGLSMYRTSNIFILLCGVATAIFAETVYNNINLLIWAATG